MRGAGPRDNQSTNFVADFAAKRAAQLERARVLREERKKPTTPDVVDRPPSGSPMTYARSHRDDSRPSSSSLRQYEEESDQPMQPEQARYSQPSARQGATVPSDVTVSEDDFARAVRKGIITPDQARQLWGVLSNPNTEAKLQSFKKAQAPMAQAPMAYDPRRYEDENADSTGSMRPYAGLDTKKPTKGSKPEWNADSEFEANYPDERRAPPVASTSKKVVGASYSVRKPPAWNDDPEPIYDEPPPVKKVVNQPVPQRVQQPPQRQQAQWNNDYSDQVEEEPPKRSAPKQPARKEAPPQTRQTKMVKAPPPPPQPEEDLDETDEFLRMKAEQARQFEEALEADDRARQVPCNLCGRTFRETIIGRHEIACAKANKKRKTFDMTKARLEGIDGAEDILRQQKKKGKNPPPAVEKPVGKIPKWKLQHQQFQAVLKNNKSSDLLSGPPIPMPEELDDRVPCPYCGRKFASDTADRHIPKCATTVNKPKSLARPIRR